jgi:hypothetical protein
VTAKEGYFGEECPRCLTWTGEGVKACPACGYPVPLAYVLPYDDPPWEYSDELMAVLRRYEALRLMARYAGGAPARLAELRQCRRLYLSRYKGFDAQLLRGFDVLDSLELDAAPVTDVDGIESARALWVLKLTECRNLERIDALAECTGVKLLSLALCNRVSDYAPIGKMTGLQSLFIEARELGSLEFVRDLQNLRSIALGVPKIGTGGVEPLFALDGLQEIALRKKLVKPADVARMRERWPDAQVTVD